MNKVMAGAMTGAAIGMAAGLSAWMMAQNGSRSRKLRRSAKKALSGAETVIDELSGLMR